MEEKKKKKNVLAEEAPRYELVEYKFLPEYLKDNPFILKYYRAEWPLKQTFLSIFSLHNETLNIWTHLVGFFIFLSLTFYTGLALHKTYKEQQPGVARWPFFVYLSGAMACLLSSSACHLLSCHSKRFQYAMRGMDCCGITFLIVSSFYPVVYYSFICDLFFQRLYLGFITASGIAMVVVSLAPSFQGPERRMVRAKVFFFMGLSGVVPIVHKLIRYGNCPAAVATTWYEAGMGALYAAATVVYAARAPERWLPGRFDIVGHSHQLFHVLVVFAAYTHYVGAVVYLNWRESEGC